jgi:hypothetical protein
MAAASTALGATPPPQFDPACQLPEASTAHDMPGFATSGAALT